MEIGEAVKIGGGPLWPIRKYYPTPALPSGQTLLASFGTIPEKVPQMSEHSPLPWKVHDAGTPQPTVCHVRENGACHQVCDCGVMQGVYDTPMALADAEFICRAANCHGELVEALKSADYHVRQRMDEGERGATLCHEMIVTLLAKAKGEV